MDKKTAFVVWNINILQLFIYFFQFNVSLLNKKKKKKKKNFKS